MPGGSDRLHRMEYGGLRKSGWTIRNSRVIVNFNYSGTHLFSPFFDLRAACFCVPLIPCSQGGFVETRSPCVTCHQGESARCYFSLNKQGIAVLAISRLFYLVLPISVFLRTSLSRSPPCSSASTWRSKHLAEGIYYLTIGSCFIVGSLLWRRLTFIVKRHRDNRRMEQGIAEYLNQKAATKE